MIFESVMNIFYSFINFLISLLPTVQAQQTVTTGLNGLVKFGLVLLPSSCWVVFISTVILFNGIQMGWAVVEWVYKKIPGVD